jgi:hypothetical protein
MRKKVLLSLLAATPAAFNAYADVDASSQVKADGWSSSDNVLFDEDYSKASESGTYTISNSGSYIYQKFTLKTGKYTISYKTLSNDAYFVVKVAGVTKVSNGTTAKAESFEISGEQEVTLEIHNPAGGQLQFSDAEIKLDYDFAAKYNYLKGLLAKTQNEKTGTDTPYEISEFTENLATDRAAKVKSLVDSIAAAEATRATYLGTLGSDDNYAGGKISALSSTGTYQEYVDNEFFNDKFTKDDAGTVTFTKHNDVISNAVAQLKTDIAKINAHVASENTAYANWLDAKSKFEADSAALATAIAEYNAFIHEHKAEEADGVHPANTDANSNITGWLVAEGSEKAGNGKYTVATDYVKGQVATAKSKLDTQITAINNKLAKYKNAKGDDFLDTGKARYGAAASTGKAEDKLDTDLKVITEDAATSSDNSKDGGLWKILADKYTEVQKIQDYFDAYDAAVKAFDEYAAKKTTAIKETFGTPYTDYQEELLDSIPHAKAYAVSKALIGTITAIDDIEKTANKEIRAAILATDADGNPTAPVAEDLFNTTTDCTTSAQAKINAFFDEKKATKEALDTYYATFNNAEDTTTPSLAAMEASVDAIDKAVNGYTDSEGNAVAPTYTSEGEKPNATAEQVKFFQDKVAEAKAALAAYRADVDAAYAKHFAGFEVADETNKWNYTYTSETGTGANKVVTDEAAAAKKKVDDLEEYWKSAQNNDQATVYAANAPKIYQLQKLVVAARANLNTIIGEAFGYNDGIKDGTTDEADATETATEYQDSDYTKEIAEYESEHSENSEGSDETTSSDEEVAKVYTAKERYGLLARFNTQIDTLKSQINALESKHLNLSNGVYTTIEDTETDPIAASLLGTFGVKWDSNQAKVDGSTTPSVSTFIAAYTDGAEAIDALNKSLNDYKVWLNGGGDDEAEPAFFAPLTTVDAGAVKTAQEVTPEGASEAQWTEGTLGAAGTNYTIIKAYADYSEAVDGKTDNGDEETAVEGFSDFKDKYTYADAQTEIGELEKKVAALDKALVDASNVAEINASKKAATEASKAAKDYKDKGEIAAAQEAFSEQVVKNNKAIFTIELAKLTALAEKLKVSNSYIAGVNEDSSGLLKRAVVNEQTVQSEFPASLKGWYLELTKIIDNYDNYNALTTKVGELGATNSTTVGSLAYKIAQADTIVNGTGDIAEVINKITNDDDQAAWKAKLDAIIANFSGDGTAIGTRIKADYDAVKIDATKNAAYEAEISGFATELDGMRDAIIQNQGAYASLTTQATGAYDAVKDIKDKLNNVYKLATEDSKTAVAGALTTIADLQNKIVTKYKAAELTTKAIETAYSDSIAAAKKIATDELAKYLDSYEVAVQTENTEFFDTYYKDNKGAAITWAAKMQALKDLRDAGIKAVNAALNIKNANYKAYVGAILSDEAQQFYKYYTAIDSLNIKKEAAVAASTVKDKPEEAVLFDGTDSASKAIIEAVAAAEKEMTDAKNAADEANKTKAENYYKLLIRTSDASNATDADKAVPAAVKDLAAANAKYTAANISTTDVLNKDGSDSSTWHNTIAAHEYAAANTAITNAKAAYDKAIKGDSKATPAVAAVSAHEALDGDNAIANTFDDIVATIAKFNYEGAARAQWSHEFDRDGKHLGDFTTKADSADFKTTYQGRLENLTNLINANCGNDDRYIEQVDADGKLVTDEEGNTLYTDTRMIDKALADATKDIADINAAVGVKDVTLKGVTDTSGNAVKTTGVVIDDLNNLRASAKYVLEQLNNDYGTSQTVSKDNSALADAKTQAAADLEALQNAETKTVTAADGKVSTVATTSIKTLTAYVTGINANDNGELATAQAAVDAALETLAKQVEGADGVTNTVDGVNENVKTAKKAVEDAIEDGYAAAYRAEIKWLQARIAADQGEFAKYTVSDSYDAETANGYYTQINTIETRINEIISKANVKLDAAGVKARKAGTAASTTIDITTLHDEFVQHEIALDDIYVTLAKINSGVDPTTTAKAALAAEVTAAQAKLDAAVEAYDAAAALIAQYQGKGTDSNAISKTAAADLKDALDKASAALSAANDAYQADETNHIISLQAEYSEAIAAAQAAIEAANSDIAATKTKADTLEAKHQASEKVAEGLQKELDDLSKQWADVVALAERFQDKAFLNSTLRAGAGNGYVSADSAALATARENDALITSSANTNAANLKALIAKETNELYVTELTKEQTALPAAYTAAESKINNDRLANRDELKAALADIKPLIYDGYKTTDAEGEEVTVNGVLTDIDALLNPTVTAAKRKANSAEETYTYSTKSVKAEDAEPVIERIEAIYKALDELNGDIADLTLVVGDADVDKSVTISDYQTIRGWILADNTIVPAKVADKDQEQIGKLSADFNGDSEINVGDLTNVLNIILNRTNTVARRAALLASRQSDSNLISAEVVEGEDGNRVAVYLANAANFVAGQFDIKLPAGMSLQSGELTNRADGLEIETADLANGFTRVLISATEMHTIASGDGVIAYLDVTGAGSDIVINNAVFADHAAQTYNVQSANTSGIGAIIVDSVKNGAQRIYDATGRMFNRLQNGLNIIRNADGTTTKQINKK